ncbi:unnamed protein product [Cyprideis torosa]|uniref:Uncharacterized protein n=1 Tax=Cyprideis torosa TaxID=163714 RepID=A0A7R8ZIM1_9CRUS|nr:unnamed protein product [Cyprideis torosa]CAG0886475.1 unnamed protein product [Cyprideis torosa]
MAEAGPETTDYVSDGDESVEEAPHVLKSKKMLQEVKAILQKPGNQFQHTGHPETKPLVIQPVTAAPVNSTEPLRGNALLDRMRELAQRSALTTTMSESIGSPIDSGGEEGFGMSDIEDDVENERPQSIASAEILELKKRIQELEEEKKISSELSSRRKEAIALMSFQHEKDLKKLETSLDSARQEMNRLREEADALREKADLCTSVVSQKELEVEALQTQLSKTSGELIQVRQRIDEAEDAKRSSSEEASRFRRILEGITNQCLSSPAEEESLFSGDLNAIADDLSRLIRAKDEQLLELKEKLQEKVQTACESEGGFRPRVILKGGSADRVILKGGSADRVILKGGSDCILEAKCAIPGNDQLLARKEEEYSSLKSAYDELEDELQQSNSKTADLENEMRSLQSRVERMLEEERKNKEEALEEMRYQLERRERETQEVWQERMRSEVEAVLIAEAEGSYVLELKASLAETEEERKRLVSELEEGLREKAASDEVVERMQEEGRRKDGEIQRVTALLERREEEERSANEVLRRFLDAQPGMREEMLRSEENQQRKEWMSWIANRFEELEQELKTESWKEKAEEAENVVENLRLELEELRRVHAKEVEKLQREIQQREEEADQDGWGSWGDEETQVTSSSTPQRRLSEVLEELSQMRERCDEKEMTIQTLMMEKSADQGGSLEKIQELEDKNEKLLQELEEQERRLQEGAALRVKYSKALAKLKQMKMENESLKKGDHGDGEKLRRAEEEVDALKKQVAEAQEENQRMKEEVEQLKEDLESMRHQLEAKEAEKKDLEGTITQMEDGIRQDNDERWREIDEIQREYRALQEKVASLEEQCEVLRLDCEKKEFEYQRVHSEYQVMNLKCKTIEAEMGAVRRSAESTVQELEQELGLRTAELSRQQEESRHISGINERLKREVAELGSALDSSRVVQEKMLEDVSTLRLELEATVTDKENLRSSLQTSLNQLAQGEGLKKEMEELRKEVEGLRKEVEGLTTEKSELQEQLIEIETLGLEERKQAEVVVEDLRKRVKELEEEKRNLVDDSAGMNDRLETLLKEQAEMELRRGEEFQEIGDLRCRVVQLESDLMGTESLETEMEEVKTKLTEALRELEETEQTIGDLRKECGELKSSVSALEEDKKDLVAEKTRMDEVKSELEKQLHGFEEKEKASRERELELGRQLEELREDVAANQRAWEEQKRALEESKDELNLKVNSLQEEKDRVEETVRELERKNQVLEEEKLKLTEEVRGMADQKEAVEEKHKADKEALELKMSELMSQLDSVTKEHQESLELQQQGFSGMNMYEKEMKELKESVEKEQTEKEELQNQIKTLSDYLQQYQQAETSWAAEFESLRSQLAEKASQNTALAQDLDDNIADGLALRHEVEALSTKLEEKEKVVELLTEEKNRLSEQVGVLEDANSRFFDSQEVLNAKLVKLEQLSGEVVELRKLKSVKVELERADREIHQIQGEKTRLETEVDALKNKVGEYEAKCEALAMENETLQTWLGTYKDSNVGFQSKESDLASENEALRKKVEAFERTHFDVVGLQEANHQLETSYETLKCAHESTSMEYSELLHRYDSIRMEHETISRDRERLRSENETLKAELYSLREEVQERRGENEYQELLTFVSQLQNRLKEYDDSDPPPEVGLLELPKTLLGILLNPLPLPPPKPVPPPLPPLLPPPLSSAEAMPRATNATIRKRTQV